MHCLNVRVFVLNTNAILHCTVYSKEGLFTPFNQNLDVRCPEIGRPVISPFENTPSESTPPKITPSETIHPESKLVISKLLDENAILSINQFNEC